MPNVKMRIKPSHQQFAALSEAHTETVFCIRDSHVIEDGVEVLYEVQTSEPSSIVRSFDHMTELNSYEVLYVGENITLLRCVIDEPTPLRAARTSGNLARSPLILRNGWLTVTFTTSDDGLSRYRDELESAGITYEIISINTVTNPTTILTDRQWEVVMEAVNYGYYKTPRECSLTELAESLGVTKGSLSRVLHRAEGHIIRDFVDSTGY